MLHWSLYPTEPGAASMPVDPLKCVMIVGLLACSVIEQLHAGSAMGTSFGCFALLAFPDPAGRPWLEKFLRKITLIVFSWGLGYAVGWGVSETPDIKQWSMLCAVGSSAMAAGVFGALNLMVANNGPLPQWLSDIVDRIPVLRKRTDDAQ